MKLMKTVLPLNVFSKVTLS